MTDKFADLEALNVRSAPDAPTLASGIGILHLGSLSRKPGRSPQSGTLSRTLVGDRCGTQRRY